MVKNVGLVAKKCDAIKWYKKNELNVDISMSRLLWGQERREQTIGCPTFCIMDDTDKCERQFLMYWIEIGMT